MFVDRQSIFSSLLSLKIITHSGEIRRFQAANIGKIGKTQTFLKKKVNFSGSNCHPEAGISRFCHAISGGDGGGYYSSDP